MRAQVSFEFILILAIFLSVLAIWLPQAVDLKNSVDEILDERFSRIAEKKICQTAEELYFAGGGRRQISVFSYRNYSPELSCAVAVKGSVDLKDGYNNVTVESSGEDILIY